ncbi:MAG: dihydroorotase [Candidatus Margulisiibacteriota bacterium]
MSSLLIKNGKVVDPSTKMDGNYDILIVNGKIAKIAKKIPASKNYKVIDAKGLAVTSGFIDMHTHLRDPGRPDKETIYSGSRAAALGGFTSICCMANTDPIADNGAVIEYILGKAKTEAVVNIFPIAAITKGLKGEEISEMGECFRDGAIAFSDDGHPVMRADIMRRAVEYAKQFGVTVISHCEDTSLSKGGSANEGVVSTSIGLPPIPAISEEIMVAREIMLAREFGRVHIAHVSSEGSIKLLRQAKKDNIPVTCETCPHYFSITEEAIRNYDTNAKVNPPLKTEKDLKAVIRGLKDGTIDVIATDHAPHNIEEKNVEFNLASSGMVGLETALGLAVTKLVKTKQLSLGELIAKLSNNPAKILGLKNKGTLKIGADADLCIFDPSAEWTVDPTKFASKSRNTPFAGWKLAGKVMTTIVAGKIVAQNGKIT